MLFILSISYNVLYVACNCQKWVTTKFSWRYRMPFNWITWRAYRTAFTFTRKIVWRLCAGLINQRGSLPAFITLTVLFRFQGIFLCSCKLQLVLLKNNNTRMLYTTQIFVFDSGFSYENITPLLYRWIRYFISGFTIYWLI